MSNVSKICESIIFRQISNYMDSFFSKNQCGFRKGYSTQQCLLSMFEKWKRAVNNGKAFGLLLTDLSKAFDCLCHELLLAKLHAYGFSFAALRLIHSYLTNRKQRTKLNSSYNSWEEILFGVLQGSILEPLLFNIYLCDMFFVMNGIGFASYADDNTPYVSSDSIEDVIRILEHDSTKLFKWFSDNMMKANKDKCHLIVSSNEHVNNKINRLHERCRGIVYSDSVPSFEDLLDKERSVSVHVKNIKILAVEMFKVSSKLTVPLMNEIFVKRNNAYVNHQNS